jgi:hypothetical protein
VDVVVLREVLALPPFEPVRFVLDEALDFEALDLDLPFPLVDLFALDPLRLERVLEELVVWAILIASLWLPCQLRHSRRRFTPITRLVRI